MLILKHQTCFFYALFVLLFFGLPVQGQDLEAIGQNLSNLRDQSLGITGNIQFSNQSYWSEGIDARRDTWQWGVRANLNFSFLGMSAPFSVAFSDANSAYRLPSYTFVGISPKYKWATLHLGDRSLGFSRYTMSGISFRGIGFTLEPGRWYASGFYGKLNRALSSDLDAVGDLNGYLKRKGYGSRLGYVGKKGGYFINFFGADDDDEDFLLTPIGEALSTTNNRVVSLELRQELFEGLTLSTELAHSVYNNDSSAKELGEADYNLGNRLLGVFQPTESLLTGQAYNLGLFYSVKGWGLQGRYERVERGFRTLGALFFNDDTENYSLGVSRNFLENKLSVIVNGGIERVNLDDAELEQTNRFIASANVTYRPDDKWMYSAGYSNFRNDTKLRTRTNLLQPVDSIFLAQVNQSINGMIIRRLGTKERPASVSLIMNHQRANNVINDMVQDNGQSQFSNAALLYGFGNANAGWRWTAGLSYNTTTLANFRTQSFSPTFGASRNFFDNALSTNMRTAFSFFQQNGDTNNVLNLSLGGSYRLKNSHNLGLNITHINRFGAADPALSFSEWYGKVAYGYRFGGSIGGKPKPPENK